MARRAKQHSIKIEGMKEIEKKLHGVRYAFGDGGEMLRKCVDLAERVANEARSRTRHPHIKRAIVGKAFKDQRAGQPASMVAIDYRIARDAHFIEFGTDQRYTKAGASRGFMPAEPFFIPAVESKADEVLEELRAEAEKEIHGAAR